MTWSTLAVLILVASNAFWLLVGFLFGFGNGKRVGSAQVWRYLTDVANHRQKPSVPALEDFGPPKMWRKGQ